jgi:hypothetical protein
MTVIAAHEHRQSVWRDTRRGSLEKYLGEILQEVELRAEAAERGRLEAEERERRHRLEWERVKKRATEAYTQSAFAAALTDQLGAFNRHRAIVEFVAAARDRLRELDPQARDPACAWLEWCERHAESLDLLPHLRMPEVPEPSASDLAPLMPGWNPHHP